jgi:CheY-like chemotaxis protein
VTKILLVEDNHIAAEGATAILNQLGCKVDLASTGSAALSMFNKGYDLILMDVGLQDVDGITVTTTIRERENPNKRTPIIALTAHSDNNNQVECLTSGMDGFISKPLSKEKIITMLDKWVPATI